MILAEAEIILARMFAPLALDALFKTIGHEWLEVPGSPDHPRAHLLGSDPRQAILSAFGTHATLVDCHALAPTGAKPAAAPVDDASAFRASISRFHAAGYSVRIPNIVPLAAELQLFARALEFVLHQPVSASLFWSAAGAQSIVHYDNDDNIVVHLSGRKRWFISDECPGLQNEWKHPSEAPPTLGRHQARILTSGDMLYLPRGTAHAVETLEESLHLAILFRPVTIRDAIIAAIDHMSDNDRTMRETAIARANEIEKPTLSTLASRIADRLAHIAKQAQSAGFLHEAMVRRSSRTISKLDIVSPPSVRLGITPDTKVRHNPLAIAHLTISSRAVDLSQPGGHTYFHPGAEPALRYICETPQFLVRDLPGGLAPEVQVRLTESLVTSGYLEPVPH